MCVCGGFQAEELRKHLHLHPMPITSLNPLLTLPPPSLLTVKPPNSSVLSFMLSLSPVSAAAPPPTHTHLQSVFIQAFVLCVCVKNACEFECDFAYFSLSEQPSHQSKMLALTLSVFYDCYFYHTYISTWCVVFPSDYRYDDFPIRGRRGWCCPDR